ncbi:MAG: glycerol-3-phosphate acyltransferase, partial [bacterium]
MTEKVITLLGAFLIGGFPTGIILSRLLLGQDIRQLGSGNPGAVNIWRVFGLGW